MSLFVRSRPLGSTAVRRGSFSSSSSSSSNNAALTQQCVSDYLISNARCSEPPGLVGLVQLLGADSKRFRLVNGDVRSIRASDSSMNPFFVPLAKDVLKGSYIGYLRWPTQKAEMDLQIAETNEVGLKLVSLNTKGFFFRQLVENDFNNYIEGSDDSARLCKEAFAIAREHQLADYKEKDFLSFFAKLNTLNSNSSTGDKRTAVDKYLLLKTNSTGGQSSSGGGYPDCYERVAADFFAKGNTISSLVTCEKAINAFYSWGHPVSFHARLLEKADITNKKEALHCARATMRMPCWTVASSRAELQYLVALAGFTSTDKLGEMHWMRSSDPRDKDISEKGISPQQIVLDQAAHVMDAVALGYSGKRFDAETKDLLADKYRAGGYPDVAAFILS